MSEFLKVLTHGRRLQGAVKELSLDELMSVQEKLAAVIEKRKAQAEEEQQAEKAKREKIAEIHKQMEEAGVNIMDLQSVATEPSPRPTGKKRPVKYELTDKNGKKHPWTGIGRMPRVFKDALDSGKKLEDFSI